MPGGSGTLEQKFGMVVGVSIGFRVLGTATEVIEQRANADDHCRWRAQCWLFRTMKLELSTSIGTYRRLRVLKRPQLSMIKT